MSSKAHADRLARALELTGLAKAINSRFANNRVMVLCRVTTDSRAKWLELLRKLLLATESEQKASYSWNSHFCQHYFLKDDEDSGKKNLVYGWNISIESSMMSDSLDAIMRVIKGEPVSTQAEHPDEITEFPLNTTGELNAPKFDGDRGAFTVGGSKRNFRPPVGGRSGGITK